MKRKVPQLAILLILCLLLIGGGGWLAVRYYRMAYLEAIIHPSTTFPLKLKWKVTLGSASYQGPAYQTGLILMPIQDSSGKHWYGLDAASGRVAWIRNIKETSFRHCLTSDYLVLSSPWSFMTLSTRTGETIWENGVSYGTTCSENTVFSTGVPRDPLEAADLASGQRFWGSIESFFGVIYNSGTDEVIATHAEDFYVFESKTGQLKYSFSQAAYAPNDGDRSRGEMYVVDQGELFIGGTVQDSQTGRIIHKEERFNTTVPPTITKDTMYLSALYDGVVAFDRSTYAVKWIYPSPQRKNGSGPFHTLSQVVILDGSGYVIFSDATVHALALETGQELGYWQPDENELWNWPVCTYPSPRFGCVESARAGLATSEDTLFVSFGDGKLYAFGR